MDLYQRRAENLQAIIDTTFHGVAARLAEKIGRQPAYVYRLFTDKQEHRRAIGEELARDIERKLGLPTGQLDLEHMTNDDMAGVVAGYQSGGDDKRTAMKDIADLPEEVASALRPIIDALKAKYDKT